jgi:hypothetical protein
VLCRLQAKFTLQRFINISDGDASHVNTSSDCIDINVLNDWYDGKKEKDRAADLLPVSVCVWMSEFSDGRERGS